MYDIHNVYGPISISNLIELVNGENYAEDIKGTASTIDDFSCCI